MRLFILLILALASLSYANTAMPGMLEARAEYVACDVGYAEDWLEMRELCADDEGVPVFDSSGYVDDLKEDLEDLRDDAKDGDRLSFGLNIVQLAGHSLELIGAVVKDAFDHKTLAFFACVREGEQPLMDDRDDCRQDAIDMEKDAAKDYVQNELDDAGDLISIYDARGIDTSGMQDVVDQGEELIDDIDDGYGSYDPKEIRALHLRHSRLVLLFRAEQMLAVIEYAEPIVEASNNDNKDEVLERSGELKDDIKDIMQQCEYEDTVDDNADYAEENLECWDDALDAFREFNDLRLLLLRGV